MPAPTNTPTPTRTSTPTRTPTATPTLTPTVATAAQPAAAVTSAPPAPLAGSGSPLFDAILTTRSEVGEFGGVMAETRMLSASGELRCDEVIRLYGQIVAAPSVSIPAGNPDLSWAHDQYRAGVAVFGELARGLKDYCIGHLAGTADYPTDEAWAGAGMAVHDAQGFFAAAISKLEELGNAVPTHTPDPGPSQPPAPPAPIAGSGSQLLATMKEVRGWMHEYGGWIDRGVRGEPIECEELIRLYDSVVGATVYSMPADDPVLLWAHDRYREGVAIFEDGARDLTGHCREAVAGSRGSGKVVATLTWTRASMGVRDADQPFHEAISRLEQDGY